MFIFNVFFIVHLASGTTQYSQEPRRKKKLSLSSSVVLTSQETLRICTTMRERATGNSRKAEVNWTNIVPDELLLGIFLYLVESEGAVPVLCRY